MYTGLHKHIYASVTYFHKWKFRFVFFFILLLSFSCSYHGAWMCVLSYICLRTFTSWVCHIKCLKLPHVLLHSTIHSISVLKHTHTHATIHPQQPGCAHSLFTLYFFRHFFHLSQAQQIAFARSLELLLWLSMSCAHNHVYRIYHVSFSTLLSVSPFHSRFRIFICQFYIYLLRSLSLCLSTSIIRPHF